MSGSVANRVSSASRSSSPPANRRSRENMLSPAWTRQPRAEKNAAARSTTAGSGMKPEGAIMPTVLPLGIGLIIGWKQTCLAVPAPLGKKAREHCGRLFGEHAGPNRRVMVQPHFGKKIHHAAASTGLRIGCPVDQ